MTSHNGAMSALFFKAKLDNFGNTDKKHIKKEPILTPIKQILTIRSQ